MLTPRPATRSSCLVFPPPVPHGTELWEEGFQEQQTAEPLGSCASDSSLPPRTENQYARQTWAFSRVAGNANTQSSVFTGVEEDRPPR